MIKKENKIPKSELEFSKFCPVYDNEAVYTNYNENACIASVELEQDGENYDSEISYMY